MELLYPLYRLAEEDVAVTWPGSTTTGARQEGPRAGTGGHHGGAGSRG
jgi:hypothetical protein